MTDATPTADLTPELRALAIMLAFPISNTDGEAEAMQRLIAEHIAAHAAQAVAEERERCARIARTWGCTVLYAGAGIRCGAKEGELAAKILRAGQPG